MSIAPVNNSIYLERCKKIYIVPDGIQNQKYVAAFLKNIEPLGYTFSAELIHRAGRLDVDELTRLYIEVMSTLKKMVGANVSYKPMYPNFPQQVIEANEGELYINSILHYLGDLIGTRILPQYEKEDSRRFTTIPV